MPQYSNYIRYIFISFALLVLSISTFAISPQLLEQLKTEHIVDTTQTLSHKEIQTLKQENEDFFQDNKLDLKILMVPSIGNTPIESYAEKVFNTIQIGHKDLNNGLLLVIAKDDHKMRIEVGYGLEGRITDVQSGRIIRHTLAPYFQKNDYYTGILSAQRELGGIAIRPSIQLPNQFKNLSQQNISSENFESHPSIEKNNITNIFSIKPSQNFINYFIALVWNISVSVIIIIYFSPIYKRIKEQNLKINGIFPMLLFIFPFHHLFTWLITGINFFLLFILYSFIFWLTLKINKYLNLYQTYRSIVININLFIKINNLSKKVIATLFFFILIFIAALGFISNSYTLLVFSLYFLFAPIIFIIIDFYLYFLAAQFYELYPPKMKIWFNEYIPSRFNPILKMINPKYIEISINGRVLGSDSTSSSSSSSSSYSSSSSSSSSPFSSSSSSSSSSNQRDSGGRSGGGGASGSW